MKPKIGVIFLGKLPGFAGETSEFDIFRSEGLIVIPGVFAA